METTWLAPNVLCWEHGELTYFSPGYCLRVTRLSCDIELYLIWCHPG